MGSFFISKWRAREDSNLRPLAPETSALSPELRAHYKTEGYVRFYIKDKLQIKEQNIKQKARLEKASFYNDELVIITYYSPLF